MSTFLLPVDASLVQQFARAIGDATVPVEDPRFAEVARSGAVVPSPTFLITADHFEPGCSRRPQPGEAWRGSGRITAEWKPPTGNSGRGLHGEQIFEYHRHPRVGEVLTVTTSSGEEWEKRGRSGTLRFKDTVYDYRDEGGAPVATAHWIAVESVSDSQPPTPAPDAARTIDRGANAKRVPSADLGATPTDPIPAGPLSSDELSIGCTWSATVIEDLTLSHLVRYAGASGDFVGVHHDPRIAHIVGGHPDVFVHGMFTMGLSGTLVSRLVGTSALTRFSGRMMALVVPGDTLTTQVSVTDTSSAGEGATQVELALTTQNAQRSVVFTGRASARVPR